MKNALLKTIIGLVPEAQSLIGKTFSLALYKNVRLMETQLKDLDRLKEPSDKYRDLMMSYQEKRKEMADKDTVGNPKTKEVVLPDGSKNMTYVITIPDRQKKVDEFLEKINKDNKTEFEDYKKKIVEYQEALNEDCGIKFHRVKEKDLPANITVNQMFAFEFMIDTKG